MSCAKTAEPIEMVFGILTRVGPNHYGYASQHILCLSQARINWDQPEFGMGEHTKGFTFTCQIGPDYRQHCAQRKPTGI